MSERSEGGREHPEPSRWEMARNLVLAVAALCAGWWLSTVVFSFTGRPPELLAFLIAVVLGVLVAGATAAIAARATGRFEDEPERIWDDLQDAIDRISRGDFSVRIRPPRNRRLVDMVDAMNNMAAGLGSVEQQRQEFISNVSHEIQSPLTSISGFASLLREPGLDAATRQHYLDVISAEVKRLSKLSDNLLRLSALESGTGLERQRFRLDEQVRSVILMLEPQWSAKDIEVDLDAVPVEIDADADTLHHVWVNLVHNAIKYTPAGGRIRVSLTAASGHCQVEVDDTGIGIAEADLPRVFERFFRSDKARSGEGNGLGLSLVKRVVELHDGEVDVTSHLGQGSAFTVSLPLA